MPDEAPDVEDVPRQEQEHHGGDQGEHPSDDERRDAFRSLRRKAARADALERENRQLREDAAFRDSGLALNDAQRDAVLGRLDGPPTAEAITEAAESLSFVAAPQISRAEQAAHQRIAAATAGAEPSIAYPKSLVDEIKASRSPEELDRILLNAGRSIVADD